MFNITSKYFNFLKINHLRAESRIQQGVFLHVILVCIIVPACRYSTYIWLSSEAHPSIIPPSYKLIEFHNKNVSLLRFRSLGKELLSDLPNASEVCWELINCRCQNTCRGKWKFQKSDLSCTELCVCFEQYATNK